MAEDVMLERAVKAGMAVHGYGKSHTVLREGIARAAAESMREQMLKALPEVARKPSGEWWTAKEYRRLVLACAGREGKGGRELMVVVWTICKWCGHVQATVKPWAHIPRCAACGKSMKREAHP